MSENIIHVSEQNEATDAPYWIIVDPRQNFEINNSGLHNVASMITGIWFSRESAEAFLRATHYNYSEHAHVYCMSGHKSHEYVQAVHNSRNAPPPAATQGGSARKLAEELFKISQGLGKWTSSLDTIKEAMIQHITAYAERVCADKQAEMINLKSICDSFDEFGQPLLGDCRFSPLAERVYGIISEQATRIAALEARVKEAREIIISLSADGIPSDTYIDYVARAQTWLAGGDE